MQAGSGRGRGLRSEGFSTPGQAAEESGRGESHPPALADPDVNLTIHPAPITQPAVADPTASGRTGLARASPRPPGTVSPDGCAASTACISVATTEPDGR